MDNGSQFMKFTRLLKYFTPILIAILYFQGYAFHAGRIESYMINESLYPLSHEQVFIQTYLFYINLISYIDYIFYTIALLFLVMLLTSIVDNKGNKSKIEITNKALIKIKEFIITHKRAFFVPIFLLALFYAAIIVVLITIIPYQIGRKETSKRLEKLKQLERYDELVIKNEKSTYILSAIILESSDKFVTVLTKDNRIKTIPFSEITSITYRAKGSPDRK